MTEIVHDADETSKGDLPELTLDSPTKKLPKLDLFLSKDKEDLVVRVKERGSSELQNFVLPGQFEDLSMLLKSTKIMRLGNDETDQALVQDLVQNVKSLSEMVNCPIIANSIKLELHAEHFSNANSLWDLSGDVRKMLHENVGVNKMRVHAGYDSSRKLISWPGPWHSINFGCPTRLELKINNQVSISTFVRFLGSAECKHVYLITCKVADYTALEMVTMFVMAFAGSLKPHKMFDYLKFSAEDNSISVFMIEGILLAPFGFSKFTKEDKVMYRKNHNWRHSSYIKVVFKDEGDGVFTFLYGEIGVESADS